MISGYLLTLSSFGWLLLIERRDQGRLRHPAVDQVSESTRPAGRAGAAAD
jgi:hypothetical protein